MNKTKKKMGISTFLISFYSNWDWKKNTSQKANNAQSVYKTKYNKAKIQNYKNQENAYTSQR